MASNFSPRPRNTLGFSLGAVGGQRGTGAGVFRSLMLFAAQYDRGNLEQLSKDVQQLTQTQKKANADLAVAGARQKSIEDEINKAKQARLNLDNQSQKALKSVLDIQARARAEEQTLGRVSQQTTAVLMQREKTFRSINGLTAQQSAAVLNQFGNEQALKVAVAQTNAAREQSVSLEGQINAKMEQGIAIATARAQAFSQIKGLLIGAVGGVVGGAIIGAVLFEPLQNLLNSVSNFTKDVTDPARHARDAIDDLGKAINGMVDEKTVNRLGAADKFIKDIGSPTAGSVLDRGVLGAAAQSSAYKDLIDQLTKYKDLLGGGVAQTEAAQQAQLVTLLAQIDILSGHVRTLTVTQQGYAEAVAYQNAHGLPDFTPGKGIGTVVDYTYYLGQAKDILNDFSPNAVNSVTDALNKSADAAAALRDELNQANVSDAFDQVATGIRARLDAAFTSIRAQAERDIEGIRQAADAAVAKVQNTSGARIDALQRRMGALQLQPSRQTQNLEAAIKALSDAGPSQRTNELADAINRLNNAQQKAAYQSQLASIAEQKHQILLAQRLALTNQQIDLDKYQGQDRIIAINALLARMQKVNEAQQRFNQLLDIQYQIGQGVKRQQGETIQDFISRRAQYYRGLLDQAAQLQRQGPQAELEAEKERVTTSLQLRDLEAQKKKLIEDHARDIYMQSLQDQLKASQERDQKELQHRRDMLQTQLEASKKADQAALDAHKQALQDRIDFVRQKAQDEIDSINTTRDADIKAREVTRDNDIATKQAAVDARIRFEQILADQAKQWASYTESQRLAIAIGGAQNIAELNRFAGGLAGANYSAAYIQTQLSVLGVDPATQAAILANVSALHDAYQKRLIQLGGATMGPPAPPPRYPPHQEGGVFLMRNSRPNPFGSDIRHGEDGRDELGIILSNKVLKQLQQQQGVGHTLFGGDMVIQTSENPYRARESWERKVRAIVKEELTN